MSIMLHSNQSRLVEGRGNCSYSPSVGRTQLKVSKKSIAWSSLDSLKVVTALLFLRSPTLSKSFFIVRGVVGCRLCPCVHVRNGVVQYAGVPNDIGSEDDMWNVGIAQFTIGWRTHSKVGKAILDIKWDDVAVRCGQALLATNLGRLVIDRNLEVFHLSARQYGLSRTVFKSYLLYCFLLFLDTLVFA